MAIRPILGCLEPASPRCSEASLSDPEAKQRGPLPSRVAPRPGLRPGPAAADGVLVIESRGLLDVAVWLPDAVVVVDASARLIWANDAAERLFGVDARAWREPTASSSSTPTTRRSRPWR